MNKKKFLIGLVVLVIVLFLVIVFFSHRNSSSSLDSVPVITSVPSDSQIIDVPNNFFNNDSNINSDVKPIDGQD